MNKPSKINRLTGGNRYSQLLSRARDLMALAKLLNDVLPTPLNEHCSILNVADTTLILAADSPAWAARLRFHTSRLVKQLAHYKPLKIRSVRIRVKPATPPAPPVRHLTKPRQSPYVAALLKQAAESISDPALKSGLLRLASRHTTR